MRAFVATVTLLALCGWLPPAIEARQASAQLGPPRSADPADLCQQQMLASPEYQALKSKLPPLEPGSQPSQAQQADPTMATPQEAKLVLSFHQKYVVPCRQEGLMRSSTMGPAIVAILVESFAKSDASYLRLVERRMSWASTTGKSRPFAPTRGPALSPPPADRTIQASKISPRTPGNGRRRWSPSKTGSASSRPWCRSSGSSIPATRRASTTAPTSARP